ncbi:MAG TPA: DUF4136 domain-containing protein [Fulvivirga sp.]|nr:DUF4136 domain-containing protein [Fulvivirga sp.]
MKNLTFSIVLLFLVGCLSYKELPVEYDYSYKGRFDKYKSYDFLTNTEVNAEDTFYIRSSIEKYMSFLGYKRKKNKPDLLLNYSIFSDSLVFRGYNQPNIEEWMKKKDEDIDYEKLNYDLAHGTLLIQVFDRKINTSIWQGYATNNYQGLNFFNQGEVRNAVRSILNKYQFFADGFLEEQLKKSQITN